MRLSSRISASCFVLACCLVSFCGADEGTVSIREGWSVRPGFDPHWLKQTPDRTLGAATGDRPVFVPGDFSNMARDGRVTLYRALPAVVREAALADGGLQFNFGQLSDVARIYLNESLIYSEGELSPYRSGYRRYAFAPLPAEALRPEGDDVIWIVLATVDGRGPLLIREARFEIGPFVEVMRGRIVFDEMRFVTGVLCALIAVYFTFLALRRPAARYHFYFAVTCFCVASFSVIFTGLGEFLFSPALDLRARVDNVAAVIGGPCAVIFISEYFFGRHPRALRIWLFFDLGLALVLAFVPYDAGYWIMSRIWTPLLMVFLLYAVYLLFRASFERHPDARYLFGAIMIAVALTLHDVAVELYWLSTPYLTEFGFLFIIPMLAGVIGKRLLRAQVELEILNETLEEQVRARTEKLEEARIAADRSNEAKSRFLADMSHEIRTPLSAIVGAAELLGDSTEPADSREFRLILESASDSLLALVNDILDISKIEAGRLELEHEPFGLDGAVDEVMLLLSQAAREKGLELTSSIKVGTPLRLRGDGQRLRQILINLIGNAVKFTEEGRVELAISMDGEARTVFRVRDTGIGIEPDQLESIFTPFAQAEASTARNFGGTGLGLTISRHLAELMGGRLTARSKLGHGTEFTLVLPLRRDEDSAPAPVRTQAPEKHPVSLRVLLVEDNPDIQLLFKALVAQRNDLISVAANGQEALDLVYRRRFDVVFMDIEMPFMDGLETTRRIRKWEAGGEGGAGPEKKPLPIYALTARALKEEVERSLAAGCSGHLSKPVRREELLGVLAMIESIRPAQPGS